MKTELSLTIDDDLLADVKLYADKNNITVSKLVEDFLKNLTTSSKQKNIVDLVQELDAPLMDQQTDLKKLYTMINGQIQLLKFDFRRLACLKPHFCYSGGTFTLQSVNSA
jgi:hypothetical protein